jgi:hypothetical protein
MAREHGRDSHVRRVILNYSIRGPLTPSISPEFYDWIGKGDVVYHGTKIEILCLISPGTHFLFCA